MFKLLCLLVIICTCPWAMASSDCRFNVRNKLKNFEVKMENDKLRIKAHDMDLSMSKKSCNTKTFLELKEFIASSCKGPHDVKNNEAEYIEYKIDNITYFAPLDSPRGRLLASYPDLFIRAKVQEGLKCPKKK